VTVRFGKHNPDSRPVLTIYITVAGLQKHPQYKVPNSNKMGREIYIKLSNNNATVESMKAEAKAIALQRFPDLFPTLNQPSSSGQGGSQ
jgi:hypothetical protein